MFQTTIEVIFQRTYTMACVCGCNQFDHKAQDGNDLFFKKNTDVRKPPCLQMISSGDQNFKLNFLFFFLTIGTFIFAFTIV